ncbi:MULTISPECIES: iron-containing alcohol dehydrogenase [unclassified Caballeronia]|uniref:iron-containing alcohol dehydrogenase n=1 Tax=unclassified Caballeronia TaxID=2646786 RepID=UPI0020285310|nr:MULTISPECIES: iron-containing alcohol dehydrogenase [unclassified Caballeronia]
MTHAAQIFAPRYLDIGGGSVQRTGALCRRLGVERPLIVTDAFMVDSGLIVHLTDVLRAAGVAYSVFSNTVPDPTDRVIDAGVAHMINGDFDGLIAFGGGSPMDAAKAINILAAARRTDPEISIRAFKLPATADANALPLIAIPTTAGTGSEVTRFTVVTDTTHNEKMLISGLGALPIAAIVDYELTMSVPPRVTADTGIDSFVHALEAFVSRRASVHSDLFARSGLALIGKHLHTAYMEPDNRVAREGMMLGATHAGIACSIAPVALVHAMARPVGAHFHISHGMSNAMLLPAVTQYSLPAALQRYAEAARVAGCAPAHVDDHTASLMLVDNLYRMNRELAVPTPRELGIARTTWHQLASPMADQALASGSPANNPRVPEQADIVRLYKEAYS